MSVQVRGSPEGSPFCTREKLEDAVTGEGLRVKEGARDGSWLLMTACLDSITAFL